MGTKDWILKGTKLITNTKKQRLKIQSRGWTFKNTILKKRKKSHKNYFKNIGTKLITNTKKLKLKIQSRVWNFKNTMLKKRRKKNKVTKIIKYIYIYMKFAF